MALKNFLFKRNRVSSKWVLRFTELVSGIDGISDVRDTEVTKDMVSLNAVFGDGSVIEYSLIFSLVNDGMFTVSNPTGLYVKKKNPEQGIITLIPYDLFEKYNDRTPFWSKYYDFAIEADNEKGGEIIEGRLNALNSNLDDEESLALALFLYFNNNVDNDHCVIGVTALDNRVYSVDIDVQDCEGEELIKTYAKMPIEAYAKMPIEDMRGKVLGNK